MNYRPLGSTGLRVSEIGFGCGNVGGLMIRGEPGDRVKAAARAMELGINYFDTAPSYGNYQSETNLGAVLKELGADVYVGTKVRPTTEGGQTLGESVMRSVEESLTRLGLEYVDLIQLHNHIHLVVRRCQGLAECGGCPGRGCGRISNIESPGQSEELWVHRCGRNRGTSACGGFWCFEHDAVML